MRTTLNRYLAGMAKRWGMDGDSRDSLQAGSISHKKDISPFSSGSGEGRLSQSTTILDLVAAGGNSRMDNEAGVGSGMFNLREIMGFFGWFFMLAVELILIPIMWFVFWEYGWGDS
ncbi:unnamed protein product, partial [Chrysoparadoxa australica]